MIRILDNIKIKKKEKKTKKNHIKTNKKTHITSDKTTFKLPPTTGTDIIHNKTTQMLSTLTYTFHFEIQIRKTISVNVRADSLNFICTTAEVFSSQRNEYYFFLRLAERQDEKLSVQEA